jgi:hypothetical protein
MEEIGKKRLAAAGAAFAVLVYFLVCAFPLQKELILVPGWTRSLVQAPESPAPATKKGIAAIPFRLGERYGYFSGDGTVLFAAPLSFGVAIANDAFAPYERLSEGFAIRSPEGAEIARVSSVGYPFFAAGRRFVVGPDQATVSELSATGAAIWSYRFSSVITAFDASPSIAVFGLMDGSVVGLDGSGAAALDFAPGGSRIAGVYGVAASPDGQLVAAITGIDRQRLVVLEKRSAAYRVAYHRYLAADYRRPVFIAFTEDGRHLAYESPSGIGVYDRDAREETVISVPATSRLGLTLREGGLMALLSEGREGKRLVCTALPDRRIADLSFQAATAFIETRGDSLFLGVEDDIVRMDLRER